MLGADCVCALASFQLKEESEALLSDDVIKRIFLNIDVIHQFHNDNFLPEISDRVKNWSVNDVIACLITGRSICPMGKPSFCFLIVLGAKNGNAPINPRLRVFGKLN